MNKKITIVALLACVALLVVWDIHVAVSEADKAPGEGATISEVTLGFAKRHPVLPFAVGVICGHLFWPQIRRKE